MIELHLFFVVNETKEDDLEEKIMKIHELRIF